MAKVLVLYFSMYGHIETMAKAVAEGARSLIGKVGSVFTSTATQHGGQETTITSFPTASGGDCD